MDKVSAQVRAKRAYKIRHKTRVWGSECKHDEWEHLEAMYQKSGLKSKREFMIKAAEFLINNGIKND